MNKYIGMLGHGVRWIFSTLFIFLFGILVPIGIIFSSVSLVVTNSKTIKQVVKRSGIYDHAPEILLDAMSTQKNEQGTGPSELALIAQDLKNPTTKEHQILLEIITPTQLEKTTTTIIDTAYAWIKSENENPSFSINLIEDEDVVIKLLTLGFGQKLRGLPDCAPYIKISKDFNPLDASCKPSGYGTEQLETYLRDHRDQKEFKELLNKTTLTSENLHIKAATHQKAHKIYRIVRYIPLGSALMLVILSGLIFIAVPHQSRAIKTIGTLYIVAGAETLIGQAIRFWGATSLNRFITSRLPEGLNQIGIETVNKGMIEFINSIMMRMLIISGSLIIIGIGLVVGVYLTTKKQSKNMPSRLRDIKPQQRT